MTVGINDISNSDADIFANIKRIVFSENSIFILNDSENYCLSESSINDPEKYNVLIRKGNGPSELIRQVDMDIMNNKIFIISQMGNYLIYDVKKKNLSSKRKINYDKKLGYINKISFIDSNRVLISFLGFSTKKLNIKNNKISHWGIFDIKRNIFKPIWADLSLMIELAKIRKMQVSTPLFFMHGVLNQNQIILTYKGADRLFVYDINSTKIIKTINVKLEHYDGFRLIKNKIYGTGIQSPSSFVDKGILHNKTYISYAVVWLEWKHSC